MIENKRFKSLVCVCVCLRFPCIDNWAKKIHIKSFTYFTHLFTSYSIHSFPCLFLQETKAKPLYKFNQVNERFSICVDYYANVAYAFMFVVTLLCCFSSKVVHTHDADTVNELVRYTRDVMKMKLKEERWQWKINNENPWLICTAKIAASRSQLDSKNILCYQWICITIFDYLSYNRVISFFFCSHLQSISIFLLGYRHFMCCMWRVCCWCRCRCRYLVNFRFVKIMRKMVIEWTIPHWITSDHIGHWTSKWKMIKSS